jgi:peptidoglycan/LPS O-acetylase OafA/YrhL
MSYTLIQGVVCGAEDKMERVTFLDGWRGLAVLAVLVQHASQTLVTVDSTILHNLGRIGVYAFFLISSFVITSQALREVSRSGGLDTGRFMLRRALRILPPLILYCCAVLMITGFQPSMVAESLRAVSFTCNTTAFGPDCMWIFGHTWSLAFEEQLYLLFPFIFARKLSLWLIPILGLLALPLIAPVHFIGRSGYVAILLLFALGYLHAHHRERSAAWLDKLPSWLVLCAPVLCLAWTALEDGSVRDISGLALPVAIFVMVFGLPQRFKWASAVLHFPPLVSVGLWSYSIYLWQQLFLAPGGTTGIGGLILALALIFLISILSYYSLEKWFRDLSARVGQAPATHQAIVAGAI